MCPIAGGNWNNSTNAGVWTLTLNNVRDNSNNNVGCRADSVSPRTPHGDGGAKGDAFRLGATAISVPAKSVGLHISSSASLASQLAGRERQVQGWGWP